MKPLEAIRCTQPNCPCECFAPGKTLLRSCDTCKHGWVAHALDKLAFHHVFNLGMQVEIVQPNIVFDIASLMLYGAHATPVRLKILLDRLFSVLQHEEVLQVLHGFGWTYEDYARGYILQDPSGRVLDNWVIASREEEYIILQQFLRFGETKTIAQTIILQDTKEKQDVNAAQTSRAESDIKKFIERSNITVQAYNRAFDTRPLFTSRLPFLPTSTRLLSPPTTHQPTYSPTREGSRPLGIAPPSTTSTPVTSSPLGRLQTMQPFEVTPREVGSPRSSPGVVVDRDVKPQPVPSPGLDSPKNLSTTPSSVQSAPSPGLPQKPLVVAMPTPSERDSTGTPVLSMSDDEQSSGAIDYSTKEEPLSPESEQKARHMRKSTNPIKRQWAPSAAFGSTFVGPNGKKRVLCTACNKTFCDKGALKIHYSAVHLKEMHKCTIDGCNMMFSSRRSRNRHSANPNPKLHMPQKRKDLPEGARLVDDPKLGGQRMISTPPTMVIPQSLLPRSLPPLDPPGGIRPESYFIEMNNQFAFLQTPEKKPRLATSEDEKEDEGPKDLTNHSKQMMEIKVEQEQPEEEEEEEERMEIEEKEAEPEPVPEEQDDQKQDPAAQRGNNRRKSNAPTRCAQTEEMYVMSDDNSDDKDPACDRPGSGRMRTRSSSHHQDRKGQSEAHGSRSPVKSASKGERDHKEEENGISDADSCDVVMNGQDESEPALLVPRKSRESLNFPKIASLLTNPTVTNSECLSRRPDLSPPRGEEADTPCSPHNSPHNSDHDSHGSSECESPSANGAMSDANSSEATSMSDKGDDPRKCHICNKVFQNQFGMKIHYQNVHLKLMHPCTVEGCTATFPSKRSRDRHSANLNLHQKLLSTALEGKDGEVNSIQSLRDDFLPTLYDPEHLNHDLKPKRDASQNSSVSCHNGNGSVGNSTASDEDEESAGETSQDQSNGKMDYTNGDDGLSSDSDDNDDNDISDSEFTGAVSCHLCEASFRDNLALKEHFESDHPRDMYHCSVDGCDKIFSTRKSRNRHSQNDNLHRHLAGKPSATS